MDIAVRDKPSSGKYSPGPDLHVEVCGPLAASRPKVTAPVNAGRCASAALTLPLTWGLCRGERGGAAPAVRGLYIMTMKYVGHQYDMANICSGTSDTYQLTKI